MRFTGQLSPHLARPLGGGQAVCHPILDQKVGDLESLPAVASPPHPDPDNVSGCEPYLMLVAIRTA